MKKQKKNSRGKHITRLRLELLECRRLLTTATVNPAVFLEASPVTGDVEIGFQGSEQISAYEIDSASGQLVTANFKSLASQGKVGWTVESKSSSQIAEN